VPPSTCPPGLDDVPAAAGNLAALHRLLTAPDATGIDPAACRMMSDASGRP
jgi:hypothetical protein